MTGIELRQYREEIGLTVEDLASRLGIAPAELAGWEAADVACSLYPMLLEHAMAKVEYDLTAMSEEEFKALQQRVEQALGPIVPEAAR
jgi:transcriptional regulator with XRE-family HTH domain